MEIKIWDRYLGHINDGRFITAVFNLYEGCGCMITEDSLVEGSSEEVVAKYASFCRFHSEQYINALKENL